MCSGDHIGQSPLPCQCPQVSHLVWYCPVSPKSPNGTTGTLIRPLASTSWRGTTFSVGGERRILWIAALPGWHVQSKTGQAGKDELLEALYHGQVQLGKVVICMLTRKLTRSMTHTRQVFVDLNSDLVQEAHPSMPNLPNESPSPYPSCTASMFALNCGGDANMTMSWDTFARKLHYTSER